MPSARLWLPAKTIVIPLSSEFNSCGTEHIAAKCVPSATVWLWLADTETVDSALWVMTESRMRVRPHVRPQLHECLIWSDSLDPVNP